MQQQLFADTGDVSLRRDRYRQRYRDRICEVCGSLYTPTYNAQRTCSRSHGQRLRCGPAKSPRPHRTLDCKRCGRPFSTSRANRVHCEACIHARDTRPPFDCEVCGTHVIPGTKGHHAQKHRYCSAKCRRRACYERQRDRGHTRDAKVRRQTRKRSAYVADVHRKAVFERDRYRCQLCGKKTRPDLPWQHPLAPTIDHILPINAGGTHEPANVQTAHRQCNSIKSDRVWAGGEQLTIA